MTGMGEFKRQFVRPMVDDDVAKLLEIRIRRISAYDIEKHKEELAAVETELEATRKKLKQLTKTVIAWLEALLEKYGEQYKRRTKVTSIEEVDKKAVASANIKLGYDEETGFYGSEVRGTEFGLQVTEYDRILAVSSDGTYRIMAPPKKVLLPRKLLYVGVFDPEKGKDFTLVYRDADRNAFGKRVHIESFIHDKEYRFFKDEKGKLDLLARRRHAAGQGALPVRGAEAPAPEGERVRPGRARVRGHHRARPAAGAEARRAREAPAAGAEPGAQSFACFLCQAAIARLGLGAGRVNRDLHRARLGESLGRAAHRHLADDLLRRDSGHVAHAGARELGPEPLGDPLRVGPGRAPGTCSCPPATPTDAAPSPPRRTPGTRGAAARPCGRRPASPTGSSVPRSFQWTRSRSSSYTSVSHPVGSVRSARFFARHSSSAASAFSRVACTVISKRPDFITFSTERFADIFGTVFSGGTAAS